MYKLAFLCFSRNDNDLEQKRVTLSLESMIKQDYNGHEVIFLDCSDKSQRFKISPHPILRVEYYNFDMWHSALFRNHLALMTEADIIIHVNTDDIYSPHMANFALKYISENPRLILHCRRKETNELQFHGIKTLSDAYKIAPNIHPRRGCAGDFQAINRKIFLEIKGYHGLIIDNKINMNSVNIQNAYQEDSWMWSNAGKNNLQVERYSCLNEDKTVNKNSKYWILHLWHPPRPGKKGWDLKYSK